MMCGMAAAGRPWDVLSVLYRALVVGAAVAALGGTAQAQTSSPPQQQETPTDPGTGSLLSSTRIRAYTDVDFGRPEQEALPAGGLQASKYSFQIADLELFITSKLSDDWSFFADTLFTSDFTNDPSVEIDRMLVQYAPNKYFRVGIGKFNSALSWYANQFHRAKFYQTTTGRPLMFADEDEGGVLPIHQVGVSVHGEIPSGSLGIHYVGEVSNGRSYAIGNPVQMFADNDNSKALAGGLSVRPDAAPALDAGFTAYRDTVATSTLAKVTETIVSAHATWVSPNFEFLNEVAVVRHSPEATTATATTNAFYSEISKRVETTRPYLRFDYQHVPADDPVFFLSEVPPPAGDRKAISAGVHFDLGAFAVVKVQFDRALQSGVWANGAHAQLAVAF